MKRYRLHLTILSTLWAFSAALAAPPHDARVRVAATLPTLGSIATAIAGDRIDLTVIADGRQDAHSVDPKPSLMVKLRKADLLLVNGLDLEIGWVPPLTEGARNARILRGGPGYIDCSQGIRVTEIPTSLSRAEGDIHPYGNPHYLTDPLNGEVVATTISAALKAVDPAHAEAYDEGRRTFVARLHDALFGEKLVALVGGAKLAREAFAGTLEDFLDRTEVAGARLSTHLGGWLGTMRQARGKALITYYRDYSYLASRFGLRIIDTVEPRPGILPSAKHIEDLVRTFQAGDARVVVTRPFAEQRSTEILARRAGARVVTLPLEVGGADEATDFFGLNDHVVDTLARELSSAAADTAD